MSNKPNFQKYTQIAVNGQVWIYWTWTSTEFVPVVTCWDDNGVAEVVKLSGQTHDQVSKEIINKLSVRPITNQPYRKYFVRIIRSSVQKEHSYFGYVPYEQAYMSYDEHELNDAVQKMDAYYKALVKSKELYGSDLDV